MPRLCLLNCELWALLGPLPDVIPAVLIRGPLLSRPADDIWLTCREGIPLFVLLAILGSSAMAAIFLWCLRLNQYQTTSPITIPRPSATPTTIPTTLPGLTPPLLLPKDEFDPNVESVEGVGVINTVLTWPVTVVTLV